MTELRPDIPALAQDLVNVDGLFDRRDERLAPHTGRSGRSVSEVAVSEVAGWLRGPRVEFNERGKVAAFQGLGLRPTEHITEMEVDGRTLYAWCAADTFSDTFLFPELLGRRVLVRSTDPLTGTSVWLSLEDGGVSDVKPSTAVLSMVGPDGAIVGDDVVPAGCGPINFFDSSESGRDFTERVEGTFLLTIEEGLELGRLINGELFASALGEGGHD